MSGNTVGFFVPFIVPHCECKAHCVLLDRNTRNNISTWDELLIWKYCIYMCVCTPVCLHLCFEELTQENTKKNYTADLIEEEKSVKKKESK